ncbi:MAG: TIGR00153 family protein [Deltaproteobacteria bacterium]|nr:TIGR00153 family protein [Deltaproteobacteria bacterium]
MVFEKIFSHGKKERELTHDMRRHILLLSNACDVFTKALEKGDRNLMMDVIETSREGDAIRREIISHIYEGAFLPYLRPDLCRFVEMVDEVFGLLKDTASYWLNARVPDNLRDEIVRVALLNFRMCEMLLISFEATLEGEDLREKMLAIRIYEKKVDEIKFSLITEVKEIRVSDFWEGKVLSDFLSGLTRISDVIEDASDHLQVIHLSMR